MLVSADLTVVAGHYNADLTVSCEDTSGEACSDKQVTTNQKFYWKFKPNSKIIIRVVYLIAIFSPVKYYFHINLIHRIIASEGGASLQFFNRICPPCMDSVLWQRNKHGEMALGSFFSSNMAYLGHLCLGYHIS